MTQKIQPLSPQEVDALEAAAESNSFVGRVIATVRDRERQGDETNVILKDSLIAMTEFEARALSHHRHREPLSVALDMRVMIDKILNALRGATFHDKREELQRQLAEARKALESRTGCVTCKGVGTITRHQHGHTHYETDSECPSYHFETLPCPYCDPTNELSRQVGTKVQEIVRLTAELAEARKDTERLDFVLANLVVYDEYGFGKRHAMEDTRRIYDTREAIDAARIAQGREVKE